MIIRITHRDERNPSTTHQECEREEAWRSVLEGVGVVAETARVVEYEGDFGEMRRSDERGRA
jgi:hypothetical protein